MSSSSTSNFNANVSTNFSYFDFPVFVPDEVRIKILNYLEPRDLAAISRVSKNWKKLTSDDNLWKKLFKQNFPDRSPDMILPSWKARYEAEDGPIITKEHQISPIQLLEGHSGEITSIAVQGNNIVTGSDDDRCLKVWDLKTGKCASSIKDLSCKFEKLAIHKNTVITIYYDSIIQKHRIDGWDLEGNRLFTLTLKLESEYTPGIAIQDNTIAIASTKSIILLDLKDTKSKSILTLEESTTAIRVLDFKENTIVAGSASGELTVWDLQKKEKPLYTINPRQDLVRSVVIEGDKITALHIKDFITRWELGTGKCLNSFNGGEGIISMAVQKGTAILHYFNDKIKILDLKTGEWLQIFGTQDDSCRPPCHLMLPTAIQGKHIISATRNHKIQVWEIKSPSKSLDSTVES